MLNRRHEFSVVALVSFAALLTATRSVSNSGGNHGGNSGKVIALLFDGFRPDYWSREGLSVGGFAKLLRDGARADAMTPDYPSTSYPNYYTLMTGLHTESHGITGNFMYDLKTGKAFIIGTNAASKLPMWWDKAEPLWITAEAQGKSAYLYYWPGCDVRIRSRAPRYCKPYEGRSPSLEETDWAIADGVEQIKRNAADFVGIYVELTDKVGHAEGPNSTAMQAAVEALDRRMAELLERIREQKLQDSVNVMVFSDHGMVASSPSEHHAVNVSEYVSDADILVEINEGTAIGYWPRRDAVGRVYDALKKVPHANAYLKNEIPERYHYREGPFVPPLLLVPDLPYVAVTVRRPWPSIGNSSLPYVGFHGYDPNYKDMKASFAAIGPAFRPGSSISTMHSVDVYQVLCFLLGLVPEPHNGTWSVIEPLLADLSQREKPPRGGVAAVTRSASRSAVLATLAMPTLSYIVLTAAKRSINAK